MTFVLQHNDCELPPVNFFFRLRRKKEVASKGEKHHAFLPLNGVRRTLTSSPFRAQLFDCLFERREPCVKHTAYLTAPSYVPFEFNPLFLKRILSQLLIKYDLFNADANAGGKVSKPRRKIQNTLASCESEGGL